MYIARILYPVEVLGRGKRIGIWFDGCPHHCHECSNPELWEIQERYAVSGERLMQLIFRITSRHPVDGFTITGGEPFFQPSALRFLVQNVSEISEDILVYSGYTLAELQNQKNPDVDAVLSRIAVLIDGKYIPEQNQGYPLRGSGNQQIYILKPEFRSAYEACLSTENRIQNFTLGNSVISVGIHRPDFRFASYQQGGA